jgi:putative flippase GtrA
MSGDGRSGTHRQIGRFLIIGGLTVLLDLAVYGALLALTVPVGPAKAVGFLAGTAFAYFANRIVTFEQAAGGAATITRFAAVYSVNLVINVAVNSLILAAAGRTDVTLALAFLVATATSAALNFLGMKYWVFSAPSPGMRS